MLHRTAPAPTIFFLRIAVQNHTRAFWTVVAHADLLLPDGTNVNHTLVKDGWCWGYRKYAPGDTVLEGLEKDAREARKGLWVGSPYRRESGESDGASAVRLPRQCPEIPHS